MIFFLSLAISLEVEVDLKASLEVVRGGLEETKGSNLRIKLKLNLEEVANGVDKKIKVKKLVQAEGCNL